MTTPQIDATTDPQAIAALQQRLDEALIREAALAKALAERHSEFDERIEHQAATNEVLKAISASPGNPQPVCDLIARQAAKLCGVPTAAVAMSEFDGEYLHLRAWGGWDAQTSEDYLRQFPMRPDPGTAVGRAILTRRATHIRDVDQDSGIAQAVRTMGVRSTVAIPLLRGEQAIGVIAVGSPTTGGFSDPQVELLGIFAEQAVIAITSAETYRSLQERQRRP
jgi:two-component system NtrC family sensor kinase